jgi:hypothetical protein
MKPTLLLFASLSLMTLNAHAADLPPPRRRRVMQPGPIIGIVIALACILLGNMLEGGHAGSMVGGPAAMIVLGGTIGAVVVQYHGALPERRRRDRDHPGCARQPHETPVAARPSLSRLQSPAPAPRPPPGTTPAITRALVGWHVVRGDLVGAGTTDKESVVELFTGFANSPSPNTNGANIGGTNFEASSDLVVNGSGLGGLRVGVGGSRSE